MLISENNSNYPENVLGIILTEINKIGKPSYYFEGNLMSTVIEKLFSGFQWVWNRLDKKAKKEVIETVVEGFSILFRSFYKAQ